MPFQFSSFIIPKGGNSFFLLEDRYVKGGLQVRADPEDRDAIPVMNKKAGMLVITQNDFKVWQLGEDLTTWKEASLSGGGGAGARQTVTYITQLLAPNDYEDFILELGKTSLILSLSVTVPVRVEAFTTSLRDDTNPYIFVATEDHLEDDGSTLMSDGSVWKNSRHTILHSAEEEENLIPFIPFRITNIGEVETSTTLTVIFIALEG